MLFRSTLFDDEQRGTAVMFYAFLPVLLIASLLLVRARYALVESLRDHNLSEPHLFELRARTLIRTLRQDPWLYFDPSEADSNKMRDCHLEIEHVYQRGVHRFPKSSYLHIMFSCFFIFIIDNKVLAYGEAQACDLTNPSFDLRFMVAFYRRVLDKGTAAAQSSEVQSYLEFKSRKEVADACVRAAAKSLFQFWSELLRPSPDIDTLSNLGHTARQAMSRATVNYEKLLQINPNSIPVLRAFAIFMMDLLGDPSRAGALFAKAENVEAVRAQTLNANMQRGDFLQRLDTNLDIFDDRNAVFGVIVDRNRLGEIESVNIAGRRQFGYAQASDLIGHNILKIIPSPLAEIHDNLLIDFLNRNESRILNTTRVAFALHKAGHIFPINLFIRWADQANGKMVGVLQAIDATNDVHLMINLKTRAVDYCTLPCYHLFGVSREKFASKEVLIHHMLPDLFHQNDVDQTERAWEQIGTKAGLSTYGRNVLTQEQFPLHAWVVSVVVASTTITFVRVHLDMADSEEDDSGSDGEFGEGDDLSDGVAQTASQSRRRLSTSSGDDDGLISPGAGAARLSTKTKGASGHVSDGAAVNNKNGAGAKVSLARMTMDDDENSSSHGSSVIAAGPKPHPLNAMLSANGAFARGSAGHRGGRTAAGKAGGTMSDPDTPAAGGKANTVTMLVPAEAEAKPTAESDMAIRKRKLVRRHKRARARELMGGSGMSGFSGTETESRITDDSSLASNGGTKRKGHKRLMRVIEQENVKTSAGLARMSRFFIVLVVLLWVSAIAGFLVTSLYFTRIRNQIDYVRHSGQRMALVQSSMINARTASLVETATLDVLFVPSMTVPTTVQSVFLDFAESISAPARELQVGVAASTYVRTRAMSYIDDTPILAMSIRLGAAVTTQLMGLLEATQIYASLIFVLVLTVKLSASAQQDLDVNANANLHYIFSNGINRLPQTYATMTQYARSVVDDQRFALMMILIFIGVIAVVFIVIVLIFIVFPVIRHIEQGKRQVLEMFLDIPRQTRRTLRRRVYALMKEEGEEAIDFHENQRRPGENGDDSALEERTAASGVASALGSGHSSSALQRYRRVRGAGSRASSGNNPPHESFYAATADMFGPTVNNANNSNSGGVNLSRINANIKNKSQEAERADNLVLNDGGTAAAAGVNLNDSKKTGSAAGGSSDDNDQTSQQDDATTESERNMRILYFKYAFLIIFVTVYMIVMSVMTTQRIDNAYAMSATVELASRRMTMMQRSYFYLREHLFSDYATVKADYPLSPLLTE